MSVDSSTTPGPNFLVIGAMKCGTSSLYQYLRSHPQVFMPNDPDEVNFFSRRDLERWSEWYRRLFAEAGSAVAIGERSTNYTKYPSIPDVPTRIARSIPDAKLIYLIRDPIERAR